jgi:hypothetical protein
MPVIYTRDEMDNSVGITCTETQSKNECRVGGWSGSFSTTYRQDRLATAIRLSDNNGAILYAKPYLVCT